MPPRKGSIKPEKHALSRILATLKPLKNQVLGIRWTTEAQPVWVLVNGFPENDASGALHHIVVNFFDITDRKKAEFLVRKNDAMNRAVLASLSAHIAVVSHENITARKASEAASQQPSRACWRTGAWT